MCDNIHTHTYTSTRTLLSRSLLQKVSIPHNLLHQTQMSATSLALTLIPLPHSHACAHSCTPVPHTHTHTHTEFVPPPTPWVEHMKPLLYLFWLSLSFSTVFFTACLFSSSLATHLQLHSSIFPACSVGQAACPCCPPLLERSF